MRDSSSAYALGGLVLWIVGLGFLGVTTTNDLLMGPVLSNLYTTGTDAEMTSVLIFFQGVNQVYAQLQFIGSLFFLLSFLSLASWKEPA